MSTPWSMAAGLVFAAMMLAAITVLGALHVIDGQTVGTLIGGITFGGVGAGAHAIITSSSQKTQ